MLLYLAAILKPWNSKQVVFAAAQAVGVYAAAVLHRTKATVAQFVLHLDVLSILGGEVSTGDNWSQIGYQQMQQEYLMSDLAAH